MINAVECREIEWNAVKCREASSSDNQSSLVLVSYYETSAATLKCNGIKKFLLHHLFS